MANGYGSSNNTGGSSTPSQTSGGSSSPRKAGYNVSDTPITSRLTENKEDTRPGGSALKILKPLTSPVRDRLDENVPPPPVSLDLEDYYNSRYRISGANARIVDKKFGRPEDYIELHVYNIDGKLLYSEENFHQYDIPDTELVGDPDNSNLTSELNMDPLAILNTRGITSGQYKLHFNIQRKKLFNTFDNVFAIKEISSTRREIKAVATNIRNNLVENYVRDFMNEINSSVFFKDFVLNFGNDKIVTAVNIGLNKRTSKFEVYFKLFEPLPTTYGRLDKFRVAEDITDRIVLNVDLGLPPTQDDTLTLRGPNLKIDTRINNSVPSSFKNYDELLTYDVTSSYENLLNRLENREIIDIDYDFIRPISESMEGIDVPYHFDNFVHFSNAVDRIKNFEYKLKLIELYDAQILNLNDITGDTANLDVIKNNKTTIYKKKEKIIKGFDGYEYFMYYDSGSFASWPKQNSTVPYTLYSVSSSEALLWLGSEVNSNVPSTSPYYEVGQLYSASLFDKQNIHALNKTIPNFIADNPVNDQFTTFTNMLGHHFDQIWTHIKHITEVNDTHHVRGISKALVYYVLKGLGLETFDQFENANLFEYILGETTTGTSFYSGSFGETGSNFVTASNGGSTPKQDIAKRIWKRLYHNAPYLLKTKGTERGIKALMNCYGVPSTILNIKEYGGPVRDKTDYKTFSYDKSSLALEGGHNGGSYFFAKINYSSSLVYNHWQTSPEGDDLNKVTFEFSIKPKRPGLTDNEQRQLLMSTSGSMVGDNPAPTRDISLILQAYEGDDIEETGDYVKYGRILFNQGNTQKGFTDYFPVFNGNFWNVFLNAEPWVSSSQWTSGANTDGTASFGAYQANFNRNIFHTTKSCTYATYNSTFGITGSHANNGANGPTTVFFGGMPDTGDASNHPADFLPYSGSFREIRYYRGENLSHETLKKHALEPFMYAGNTPSSSYENLILRLPLGSNNQQDSSSFHPNQSVSWLGMEDGVSSSLQNRNFKQVEEIHHLPTPDTVGRSTTSRKVRNDAGTVNDDILSVNKKTETSTQDNQPLDYEDLGVFLSPTNELNEDILYTLGSFRLDDYIGSPLPSVQTSSRYEDLKDIKDIYFKKVERRYNYWDYLKLVQQIDHTLFKLIEQWVPFKANLKTGVLVEPHFLERNKFARELPVREDLQTMTTGSHQTLNVEIDRDRSFSFTGSKTEIDTAPQYSSHYNFKNITGSAVISHNSPLFTTGSDGNRNEQGGHAKIDVWNTYQNPDVLFDPNGENNQFCQAPIVPFTSTKPNNYKAHSSNALLGNARKGVKSNIYYKRRLVLLQAPYTNYSPDY